MRHSTLWIVLLLIITLVSPPSIHAGENEPSAADLELLLDGVDQIAAPGVPGPLCVFGESAFPVVTADAGRSIEAPVVAAARWGAGRVFALGHDGYLSPDALSQVDTAQLLLNAIIWSASRRPADVLENPARRKNLKIAVHANPKLAAYLADHGFSTQALASPGWTGKIGRYQVLCFNPVHLKSPGEFEAIGRFVRSGRGLIVVGLGWGWLQLNPGRTLARHHPGNRLLAPAGIVFGDGYLNPTCPAGYRVDAPPGRLVHAAAALEALAAHDARKQNLDATDLAQASWIVLQTTRALPPEDRLLRPRIMDLIADRHVPHHPPPEHPLSSQTPLSRLALTLELDVLAATPPEKIEAHPAATTFPGAVPPDAPRVIRTVTIDTSVPGWHGTGLYAPPGARITVEAPTAATRLGLFVRIGAHNDGIWHLDPWKRAPVICRRDPLHSATTTSANAFGGLVYIEVPAGCKPAIPTLRINGCVEAPRYVLGTTSEESWRTKIRRHPAPWAELETAKVVLTVPSRVVRTLDSPEELMLFWDQVLDCCAELAQRPTTRERPERYVTDVQISAGYMHSGYPIMTHLDIAETLVSKSGLVTKAHGGVWGLFHEMGHNHQSPDWTYSGTVEVTCNLFTLFVFDRACGIPPRSHDNLTLERRKRSIATYRAEGASFEKWQRDPFLALIMYVQLQEAFGWETFQSVFAAYRILPAKERPRTDAEKRDQWMVRFSRAVERDLGPFFTAWGVPTSKAARASIEHLPPWTPAGFAE